MKRKIVCSFAMCCVIFCAGCGQKTESGKVSDSSGSSVANVAASQNDETEVEDEFVDEMVSIVAHNVDTTTCVMVDGLNFNLDKAKKEAELSFTSNFMRRKSVVVPKQITAEGQTYKVVRVGDYTFMNAAVRSVTLPETIRSLGNQCFTGSQIRELVCPASIPPSTDYSTFGDGDGVVRNQFVTLVPRKAIDAYKSSDESANVCDPYIVVAALEDRAGMKVAYVAEGNEDGCANIRQQASSKSEVVGELSNCTIQVSVVLEQSGNWYKVDNGEVVGYIHSSQIDVRKLHDEVLAD